MDEESAAGHRAEYRIEDLALHSGATVRTIRAYQDRGLLPRPERRGRANVYGTEHLARLQQTAELLDRGYTLASIKELLEAWDAGRGLGGVLGLVAEVDGPWTDEESIRISRSEPALRFSGGSGGTSSSGPTAPGVAATEPPPPGAPLAAPSPAGPPPGADPDDRAIADAVELGVLERVPGQDDVFLVPSPQELSVAVELHAAGVPLSAISGQLRELRVQVEHIAARFLEFTVEHVFDRWTGPDAPTEADASEAAALVRRLRPLARQAVDAELARAMRSSATRQLHRRLSSGVPDDAPQRPRATEQVPLPMDTVNAVRGLVGPERVAAFVAAAAQREVQARTLDALASSPAEGREIGQIP